MLFYSTTIDGLQMGLCFAVLALGVYISFAILDFPDLSVDGTFPLGGVISTVLMLRLGMHPVLAVALTFFVGMAAGTVTGLLHVRCRISKILAGIIVMTGLLSVNLALTKLLSRTGYTTTIFSYKSESLAGMFSGDLVNCLGPGGKDYMILAILAAIVAAVKLVMDLFLRTKTGYMLRATGNNEQVVVSLGHDSGNYKILGLALSNGFVSVSGAIYSQLFFSYDNTAGTGKAVMALASVIIGVVVFANLRHVGDTLAVIFGAVIYSLCLNYLVLIDTNGIYLKLMNAVLFALILIFSEKISAFLSGRRKGGALHAGAAGRQ